MLKEETPIQACPYLFVIFTGAACDVGLNYEDEHEKKSRVHPLVEVCQKKNIKACRE